MQVQLYSQWFLLYQKWIQPWICYFCSLDILDNNLSGYLMESMSVGNVCNDRCMHLMTSSKQFVDFSSQWIRSASANNEGLIYSVLDALETSRHGLIWRPNCQIQILEGCEDNYHTSSFSL